MSRRWRTLPPRAGCALWGGSPRAGTGAPPCPPLQRFGLSPRGPPRGRGPSVAATRALGRADGGGSAGSGARLSSPPGSVRMEQPRARPHLSLCRALSCRSGRLASACPPAGRHLDTTRNGAPDAPMTSRFYARGLLTICLPILHRKWWLWHFQQRQTAKLLA